MSAPSGDRPGPASPEILREVTGRFHLATGESLLEASRSRPLAVVFLRHFGCTFTRRILRGLEELQRAADTRGARLVLVHMLRDGDERPYLGSASGTARIADPKCELYRAFGLGKGSFLELFGPKVWMLGLVSLLKGCGAGRLAGDGRQMPGAFVFENGAITASQRAASAADLPDLPALFAPPSAPGSR
jgi:hypothetical protein